MRALPCSLCDVFTRVDCLQRSDVFPLGLVCDGCSCELQQDEEDPTAGDRWPEPTDRYVRCNGLVVCRVSRFLSGWYRAEAVTFDGSNPEHFAVDRHATVALAMLEQRGIGPFEPADDFTRAVLRQLHPDSEMQS